VSDCDARRVEELSVAHMMAKLKGVELSDVEQKLSADASAHAEQGMHLEHLWADADHPDEVLFLFRIDDLEHCRRLMERVHIEARLQGPHAKLPETIFLHGR
jgi:hypothetical protein